MSTVGGYATLAVNIDDPKPTERETKMKIDLWVYAACGINCLERRVEYMPVPHGTPLPYNALYGGEPDCYAATEVVTIEVPDDWTISAPTVCPDCKPPTDTSYAELCGDCLKSAKYPYPDPNPDPDPDYADESEFYREDQKDAYDCRLSMPDGHGSSIEVRLWLGRNGRQAYYRLGGHCPIYTDDVRIISRADVKEIEAKR